VKRILIAPLSTRIISKVFINLALVVSLSLYLANDTYAGADFTSNAGACITYPNAAVTCLGDMYAIRSQTADPNRYAQFSRDITGSLVFKMKVNDVDYACSAPSSFTDLWHDAMATNAYFVLRYDANGVCYYLYVANGSGYKNINSL